MSSLDVKVKTENNNKIAFSELGTYFTDTHITNYIYNNIKSSINSDGTIEIITDKFSGSSGFTTGYINYLNTIHNDTKSK